MTSYGRGDCADQVSRVDAECAEERGAHRDYKFLRALLGAAALVLALAIDLGVAARHRATSVA